MPEEIKHRHGPFVMTCWFYSELLPTSSEQGRMPRNMAAHALWHYFMTASSAYKKFTKGIHYVGEQQSFNGRQLFESIAKMYGVSPAEMCKFWDVVDVQRIALGLAPDDDLPQQFKYRISVN